MSEKYFLSLLLTILFCLSCSDSDEDEAVGPVTDYDGNVYNTVKIGDQWWMAENLKVLHYRNGEAISIVTDSSQWSSLTTGAYCYYGNNSSYANTYGCLYNWYAVDDSRGLAPKGWHIPTSEEWSELENSAGMGAALKEVGTAHWQSPNTDATNKYGFAALPGGSRSSDASFVDKGYSAYFWTSTTGNCLKGADYKQLYYDNPGSSGTCFQGDFRCGISVRCVKD
jgi:uncharacterized protein (TIGR02145 family)